MNRKHHLYALSLVCLCSVRLLCSPIKSEPWAWLYHKKFTKTELEQNAERSILQFSRKNVPNFTQLLFSWNAFRPQEGHFSFYVQARNAKTKQWGPWHKMIEWGKDKQRSYLHATKDATSYYHVRLETEKRGHADAFQVKIEVHDGAKLETVKGLSVAISNYKKFKREHNLDAFSALASVHVKQVPQISQFQLEHPEERRICSPISMSMLASFFAGKTIDPVQFAANVYDRGLQAYGSWPFNTAQAFDQCTGKVWFFTVRMNSFKGLHAWLRRGIPVVASVRGPLEGGARPYKNGHLLLVVGWDARTKEVICHDPAFQEHHQTLTRYSLKTFLRGWERSHRLVYLAEPVNA